MLGDRLVEGIAVDVDDKGLVIITYTNYYICL